MKKSKAAATTKVAPKKAASSSTTATHATGSPADTPVWSSIDPRNGSEVVYSAEHQTLLEMAYQNKTGPVKILLGTTPFTVHFDTMTQRNQSGGSRQVVRQGPIPKLTLEQSAMFRDPAQIDHLLGIISEIDRIVATALEKDKVSPAMFPKSTRELLVVYMAMLDAFQSERYKVKYHYQSSDASVLSLPEGASVPQYYANVKGQSMFMRKVLSILGLRNLVLFGAEIYQELAAKLFTGNSAAYADKTGTKKMLYYTGNTVDLDTTVLRCTGATLDLINKTNAKDGLPQYSTADDFSSSSQARELVLDHAKHLLDDFCSTLKLSEKQKNERHVNLDPNAEIPVATSNSDRGRWPVWHYMNLGMNSFHVNVPTMSDVSGSLLLAPFHICRAFLMVHKTSTSESDFAEKLDEFFEDAVADTCFNQKWRAVEAFCLSYAKVGSISNILAELQRTHQKKFTPAVLASEENEVQVMFELLPKGCTGKDDAGNTRPITKEDVAKWVRDSQ